ncbi:glycerophosphodiester phosphodiesterase family protein [Paraherbaspirillum soli]|uniref:Glycerophosphodiester phosphodiesterase family protein n=1 Tax=Paraherbaspirillum soli TaxID=631222 RepID=A0ABW0MDH4_9BURK
MQRLQLSIAATLAAGLFAGCAFQPDGAWSGSKPLVIAHRGGTGDYPENTLLAIRQSLADGADGIWLSVQISRDNVPVLYRPQDLSALTNAAGPVRDKTVAELARVNAAWQFKRIDAAGVVSYPYREQAPAIPTLREALLVVPPNVPILLDMKAVPADVQAKAVAQVLDEQDAWERVRIYSTDAAYQMAFATYPKARMFESRDDTRTRLFQTALGGACQNPPPASSAAGFEYRRDVQVIEKFTLGEGVSKVRARTWSPNTIACFRTNPNVEILAIGINSVEDYRAMACLGVDAVLVDSPRMMAGRPRCQQ